jgi:hypothetical protein
MLRGWCWSVGGRESGTGGERSGGRQGAAKILPGEEAGELMRCRSELSKTYMAVK